jgi:hypothetical protein
LEAVINGCVGPELLLEAAFPLPANATPLLLEPGVRVSVSLCGGRG